MKRYEGLFVLNTAGKEEGVKEAIDRVTNEITAAGGKVETVQKMDRRPFARVADKKYSSGFYVNVIFAAEPAMVTALRNRFVHNEEVFRALFTIAPELKPVDTGLFAGAVLNDTDEFKRLFFFFRFMANSMAGNTPDRRDWDAIRTWAEGLRTELAV